MNNCFRLKPDVVSRNVCQVNQMHLVINFWLAADVDSKYVLNSFPYLGKDEERHENLSLSEYFVLRLVEPFVTKGRNISTNNIFTTLNLPQILKTKNITLTGTMKRNRKEVPEFVKK
ncbi:piggyBac transposable element-derived protein 4 [Trichonephila clavipes]|nr:piggyBac transposable element-derived protein 4 [Trichonephila clavipes]